MEDARQTGGRAGVITVKSKGFPFFIDINIVIFRFYVISGINKNNVSIKN